MNEALLGRWTSRLSRAVAPLLAMGLVLLVLTASPVPPTLATTTQDPGMVVEQLRLRVPAAQREAWLQAERDTWQPWLEQQQGFLGRELLWDPLRQEATLLIRWLDRDHWQAAAAAGVEQVQQRFEQRARQATGSTDSNPFPLVYEGELLPQ